jgi:hypothetical protein
MHIWPMLITWKQAIIIIRPQSCLLKPTATENDNRSDGGASPCAAVFYVGECCCTVGGRTIGDLKVVVRGAGPHVPSVRGIMVSHEMIRRIGMRSYVWRERALSYQIRFTTSRTPVSGRTVMDMVGIGNGCVPSSKRKRATRVARMM